MVDFGFYHKRRYYHVPHLRFLAMAFAAAVAVLPAASLIVAPREEIFLVSLPHPSAAGMSPVVSDLWRWKDCVLGNGVDFFVPRVKTLRAFNSFLLGPLGAGEICEAATLSNCARMEVYLRVRWEGGECGADIPAGLAASVGTALAAQLSRSTSWGDSLTSALDVPSRIVAGHAADGADASEVARHLTPESGVENIAKRLCEISAGMALRPSRPGRPVPFRPYSSRDAHVLLQMRRAREAVATTDGRGGSGTGSGALSDIFLGAVRAGAEVRSSSLPEVREMRPYGGREAPASVASRAEVAVRAAILTPAAQEIEKNYRMAHVVEGGFTVTERITQLREKVREGVGAWAEASGVGGDSEEIRSAVQRGLHRPTVDLREGKLLEVDANEVIQRLQVELETKLGITHKK
eukprot:CAMPEP_0194341736 /NCGR_PEP_ID=MMETSP0171-20130528/90600_1 /TAXON_ID=218684 /ORGANISM="Corethron pennatum, Strain L29A3" /LENGTH=406 /DNA_ID=CAMNT_0039107183 /DNA_START=30 /DNA_END=1250 /DNA_ORIENTATION=+